MEEGGEAVTTFSDGDIICCHIFLYYTRFNKENLKIVFVFIFYAV